MNNEKEQTKEQFINKYVNDGIRQWKIDAGGMSVMCDDVPDSFFDQMINRMVEEAEKIWDENH